MPALILGFLGRFAPWIAAGVLALAVVLYGWHLHAALGRAEAALRAEQGTIGQLRAVNAQDVAQLRRLTLAAAAWQAALATAQASDMRAATASARIMTAIAAAPARDDGPVAPVLARTLAAIAAAQGGAK